MPTGWLRHNHGRHQMLGRPQSNWSARTVGDEASRGSARTVGDDGGQKCHLEEFLAGLKELNVRLLNKPTISCLGVCP